MLSTLIVTSLIALHPSLSPRLQPDVGLGGQGQLALGGRLNLNSPQIVEAAAVARRFDGALLNGTLVPKWFARPNAKATHLAYRAQRQGGATQWMVVDLANGKREPAFDHAKLVAELKSHGIEVSTDNPAVNVSFADARSIQFVAGQKPWTLDRSSGKVVPGAAGGSSGGESLPGFLPARRSGSGEGTSLTLENRSSQTVDLYWIDNEGGRRKYHTLSPGQSIAQNTYAGHVWVFVSQDGKDLAAFEATEAPALAVFDGTSPSPPPQQRPGVASPDGSKRALIRDYNVWVDGKALSTDGTRENRYESWEMKWSPSGRFLAVRRVEQGDDRKVTIVRSSPENQLQPTLLTFDYLKPGDRIPRHRITIFEPGTGKAVPLDESLTPNPWSLDRLRWVGEELAFVYNERGHQTLRWLMADPATGKVRVAAEDRSPTFLDYSSKLYAEPIAGTSEGLWMSERSGFNHLYRIDLKTGQIKNPVTAGDFVVREVVNVDAAKGEVLLRVMGADPKQSPYHSHYWRVSLDGKRIVRLTEADANHRIRFSPDGETYVDSYSRVDLPPTHELRRTSDGKLIAKLEDADASALEARRYPMPERFVAKGRDGETDIWGVIWKPIDFHPSRKYAVIESIYAGPHGHHIPMDFNTAHQQMRLAELGFVVVSIDGMGTNWRSKKFHDVAWRNLADSGFPDRILWMKSAAKDRPWMDLDRVGIYGTSAGGQNAASAVFRFGEFYKAAVADCGCHDNRMDKIWWNEQWMGYPVGPWYAENSNVTAAKNLTGSLFLMVGEVDTNVDPASTAQVVDALIKAGKDFELLVAPGVGHGVLGTPYGVRRMLEYFVRTLGVTARSN